MPSFNELTEAYLKEVESIAEKIVAFSEQQSNDDVGTALALWDAFLKKVHESDEISYATCMQLNPYLANCFAEVVIAKSEKEGGITDEI